jgi:hypothetical protein
LIINFEVIIMSMSIADVRAAINIPETTELADLVITSAITRATAYISVLQNRYAAPSEYFPACENQYAIFLAYQAYADRVLNVPPGAYQEGQWTPVTPEISRDTGSKLQSLRQVYEDLEKIIKSFPTRPYGLFQTHAAPAARFSVGQFDYGSQGYSQSGWL